jgi:oligopeptide transport system substrate-binding protein
LEYNFLMNRAYLLLIIVVVGLWGCDTKTKQTAKVFRYNQSSGIASLDPAFSKDQATIWACNQLYNGLVQLNDSLVVIPAIAEHWEISDSGRIYTFHLRKDVQFHNDECFGGKEKNVNAYDFVYSFLRIIDPKVASPGSWIFSEHIDSLSPFVALDSFTFQIKLRKPFLPLMGILTMQYCSVIPQEAIAFYGPDFRAHPVGTGPFRFKKWREGVALILDKKRTLFRIRKRDKLPYLDGMKVSFITDKKSEFLAFRSKELDFVSGLDASYIDEVIDDNGELKSSLRKDFTLSKSPYLNTEYVGFNLEKCYYQMMLTTNRD